MERVWFERDNSSEMVVDFWREADMVVLGGNLSDKFVRVILRVSLKIKRKELVRIYRSGWFFLTAERMKEFEFEIEELESKEEMWWW